MAESQWKHQALWHLTYPILTYALSPKPYGKLENQQLVIVAKASGQAATRRVRMGLKVFQGPILREM